MNREDKLLLEVYKAIGTPDEIITRLDSPYPDADEGYAPLPLSDHEKVRLLEDDGMGSCPFEDDSCTISINDWEA